MVTQGQVPEDRAVIDRIVDGASAVLLVGSAEHERVVDAAALPEGAREGDWLVVDLARDPLAVIAVDQERTACRREQLEAQLEQIRERQHGGRFPRR